LCFLKINIKMFITYLGTSYYYGTLNYITHLISHIYTFFLAQPVLQLHLTMLCPSPIDCKWVASRVLILVFESTSASDKPWKVDRMNWFLEKVEFGSPCLIPSWYCSVYKLKCVTMYKIFRRSPRPLSTLCIDIIINI